MTTTEQAIAGLASYLQSWNATTGTFKSGITDQNLFGRRLKYWNQVGEYPALFLLHLSDEDSYSGIALDRTIINLQAWIYAKPGQSEIPDTVLACLSGALVDAMAPDDPGSECFTIGGLVTWCRVEGTSEFYPGDTGEFATAIIPIKILLTS